MRFTEDTSDTINFYKDATFGGDLDVTGAATFGSFSFVDLTVTGDLTVDADTLFVDASEDKVGIGTTSPSEKLEVAGSIRIDNGASFTSYQVYRDNIKYGDVGGGSNQFTIQAANNKNIAAIVPPAKEL